MKKTKLALLALVAMSLIGCTDKIPSATDQKPTVSDETALPANTDTNKESETVESVLPSDSSESTEEKPISTDGGDKPITTGSESENQSTDYYVGWSSELIQLMQDNLNGEILPYVNLGRNVTGEAIAATSSVDAHIEIYGGEFDANTLLAFQPIYEACGYTVSIGGTTLTAINEVKGLKVLIGDFDKIGLLTLKAFYDEPFDPSAATGWNQDALDFFNYYLHGHVLPYTYLGTVSPLVNFKSNGEFEVIGGTWNDQVLALAASAYPETGGWNPVLTSTSFSVKNSFDDGCAISFELKKNSKDKACVTIKFVEVFNPASVTAWDSKLAAELTTTLHGHTMPFIYLGATNVTYKHVTDGMEVYGGYWNDQVTTLAEQTLTAANWVKGAVTSSVPLTMTFTEADTCELTFTLKKNTNGKIVMTIKIKEAYVVPANGAWTTEILDHFTTYFAGDAVPYIHLGTSVPTFSKYSNGNEIDIKGGYWNDEVVNQFDTILGADGWTIYKGSKEVPVKSTDNGRMAYKRFDNRSTLVLTLYNSGGKIQLWVNFQESYISNKTSWDASISKVMSSNCDGYVLPYFYMGENVTASYVSTTKQVKLSGSRDFNFNYVLDAKPILEADGYTCTLTHQKTGGIIMTAHKESADGFEYDVNFSWAYSKTSSFDVYLKASEPFNPAIKSAWNADTLAKMTDNMDGYSIPYVYLGTSKDSATYSSSTKTATITGGKWDDQITGLFQTAFENDTNHTWTITTETEDTKRISARTDLPIAGSYLKATLYTSTVSSDETAKIDVEYNEGWEPAAATGWQADIQTVINDNMGTATLPYIYLGAGNYTHTYNDDKYTLNIIGKTWNGTAMVLARDSFTNAGWTVSTGRGKYSASIQAYKIFDDGSMLRAKLYRSSSSASATINMTVIYCPPVPTTTVTAPTSYSKEVTTLLSKRLKGHMIPYIPLGEDQSLLKHTTETSTSVYTNLYQSSMPFFYDSYIFKAKDILEANGYKAVIEPFYDTYDYPLIYALKTEDDGSRTRISIYSATTNNKFDLYCSNNAAYTTGTLTDWDIDTKNAILAVTGGVEIPYFSLGTGTIKNSTSSGKLTLTGGSWSDDIFSIAQTKIATMAGFTWSFGYDYQDAYRKTFVAYGDDGTGGTLIIKVYDDWDHKFSDENTVMTIQYLR